MMPDLRPSYDREMQSTHVMAHPMHMMQMARRNHFMIDCPVASRDFPKYLFDDASVVRNISAAYNAIMPQLIMSAVSCVIGPSASSRLEGWKAQRRGRCGAPGEG